MCLWVKFNDFTPACYLEELYLADKRDRNQMILAIDVHYKAEYAKSVGVLFNWRDEKPIESIVTIKTDVAEYIPGQFYKRELPCLLALIANVDLAKVNAIVVDGHVYIDNQKGHGLGGYLWEALNQKIPVIGVAKRAFHKNEETNQPVLRGESQNPLYVSAIGLPLEDAVQWIQEMHGDFRMPTILQILDTETKKE